MTQYIDKAPVVAEIDRWRDEIKEGISSIHLTGSDRAYATFEYEVLGNVKDFLDTFEVKEVDLEEEVDKKLEEYDWEFNKIDFYKFARHFFELGLNAQKGE